MRGKLCWMILPLLAAAMAHADVAAWEAQMAAARQAATFGYYQNEQVVGDWGAAVRHYKAAVKEAEKFPSPDPRLAESLYALGLCYTHLPDNFPSEASYTTSHDQESYLHRAALLYQRAAAICEKAYGKGDPRMALTECKLGELDSDFNTEEMEKASVQRYNTAQALLKKALPRDITMTVAAYDLLSDYYNDDALRLEEMQRLALTAAEQAYGKDDPRTADRRCRLALVMADGKAAEALFHRAVSDVERASGPADPRAEEARCRFAIYLAAHRRLPEAHAALSLVLANAEKAYGAQDPRLLPVLYHLVNTLATMAMLHNPGQQGPDRKLDLFVQRIAMNAYLHGTAVTGANGDEEVYLTRATAIAAQAGDLPAEVDAWSRLAAYYRVGEQAWKPLENALAVAEKAYGKEDARILPSLFALAEWSLTEDPTQIDPLFQRATAIIEHSLGADLHAIEQLERIATVYEKTDRKQAARAIRRRIGEIESTNPQADPDDVVAILKQQIADAPAAPDGAAPTPEQARLLDYIAKIDGPASLEMVAQIQQLLDHVLPDPGEQRQRQLYYLHRLAEILPKAYAHPQELAAALNLLGERQAQCRLRNEAIASYTRALTLLDQQSPPDISQQYTATRALGELCQQTSAPNNVENYLLRTVQLARRIEPSRVADDALKQLSNFYRRCGQPLKADAVYQQRYQRLVNKQGETDEAAVRILLVRARLFDDIAKPAQAAPLLQSALVAAEKDPRLLPHAMNFSGQLLGDILRLQYMTDRQLGQTRAADACLERLFGMASGRDPAKAAQGDYALLGTAEHLVTDKQYALASTLIERLLALQEQRHGKESPQLEIYLQRLGEAYLALHNTTAADTCYARMLTLVENTQRVNESPYQRNKADALRAAAAYYRTHGREDLVEALWRRQLARDQARYPDRLVYCTDTILKLCDSLTAQKKYAEAEAQLTPLLASAQADVKTQPVPAEINLAVGKLYAVWGKPEQALPYLCAAYTQADTMFSHYAQTEYLLPYAEAYASVLITLQRDMEAQPLLSRIAASRSEQMNEEVVRRDWDEI